MHTARVGFAGLSSLCEDILQAALRGRQDIELVAPWTQLPALAGHCEPDQRELLFIELVGTALPPSLRGLLVAAPGLTIVGLSPDARSVTLFTIREQRTVLLNCSASELWRLVTDAS